MRFGKLYFKIILAFIAVLVAAEVVVYTLVHSGKIHPPFFRNTVEQAAMIDLLIEREMTGQPATEAVLRERVDPLLHLLVKGFDGHLWITDANGRVVSASMDGPPPPLDGELGEVSMDKPDNIRFYTLHREKTRSVYLTSAIVLGGRNFTVHLLYGEHPRRAERWFFHGLLLLTFFGALFIFPVSRMITKPIRRLTDASERLGRGDFSRRVPERGRDEVAELARKFNRMADRLERMVMSGKELTAHLSHELRSPLARLRISLQMVMEREEETTGQSAKLLEGMQEEIEHMDWLIGRILDLSKLDMQGPPSLEDRVDVPAQLSALLKKYEPMVESRGVRLSTDLSETPELRGHAHAVEVLFDNILANAFKYTVEGGEIRVAASAGPDWIAVKICNTHPPLSDKDLSAMFMPFHRLDPGEAEGTGIGLAAASRIVELHHGTIAASNEDGMVCIRVSLPLE
ncbi:sensor histidine kinase [Salidesulfovibrio brasiliensis]|uniref:sensor histidine kinase n=1 Tax=Salidesulfovibrio brasiliensis TaxID=221711 RepID=UPI0006CF52F2|nr:HAMP domain-containing sensor histidine kinase [Salidesulfovibrio brasiliensis]